MTSTLFIGGMPVPLKLRRNGQAQRMSLRVDQRDGTVVLVLPTHVPKSQGIAFATAKADWLASRLAALPPRIPFHDGAEVPLLGTPHRLHHSPLERRGVWLDGHAIHVSGQPEHFARRVTDWLRRRARDEVSARALPMAQSLGRPIGRLSLRDTRSRWGSCNNRGDLAFSWRLVLAPVDVLTYVIAHEVAHLVELNHSSGFWQLVDRLAPGSEPARHWLKCEGAQLHRYG